MSEHDHQHKFENVRVEKGDRSDVTITAEIPAAHLETYRKRALKKLSEEVSIDGFRKGHVPEDVLVKHVGVAELLRHTASLAIEDQYPHLMHTVAEEHELPIIGTPNVSVTKLAPENPIEFSVQAALMPTVKLPDYKKIAASHAKKKEAVEVKEEEMQDTLTHLRRERAKIER